MIRNSWTFQYLNSELTDAAQKKFAFHSDRLKWWEQKKSEVMSKIKENGIDIDESVALGYSNSGRNASVTVRVDLVKDLQECVSKISEHRTKVSDYDAWIQVLSSQHGQGLQELQQEDWLFFFGK